MISLKSFFARSDDDVRREYIKSLLRAEETRNKQMKPSKRAKKRAQQEQEDNTTSIEVIEYVDMRKLQLLYARRKEFLPDDKGQQTAFFNYYTNTMAANGERRVVYCQKDRGNKFGRYSPQFGTSLQNIRREVRATIARDIYWQLDITNAHPWMLISLAESQGWEMPLLRKYVENREEMLAKFGLPRDVAKRAMLILMYGGNVKENIGRHPPLFVGQMKKELVMLAKRMYENFPMLVKRLKSDNLDTHKRLYSFLSKILQDREAKCLQISVEFMREHGWKPGALIHDGLLVLKRSDGAVIDRALLDKLAARIEEESGLRNIHFELKEFEPGLDVDNKQTLARLPDKDEQDNQALIRSIQERDNEPKKENDDDDDDDDDDAMLE